MERIELNGRSLVAKELTVAEMDLVLNDLRTGDVHPLERVFSDEPITAKALSLSLEVDANELLSLPCGSVSILIEEVKKQNPFLQQRMEKLASILEQAAREKDNRERKATMPSPSSEEISVA